VGFHSGENLSACLFDGLRTWVNPDLGGERGLVGIIHSRKVADLPLAGLRIEPLGIAALALGERRRYVYLDKIPADTADEVAGVSVGRHGGRHDANTLLFELAREKAESPHVLVALGPGEAGLGKEPPDHLAVELLDLEAFASERVGNPLRQAALPRCRKARQPNDDRLHLFTAESKAVPHPLVEPEEDDLGHELEYADGQREYQPAGDDEHDKRRGDGAHDAPGNRLGDRAGMCLSVHAIVSRLRPG